jgi:hypothetical protein
MADGSLIFDTKIDTDGAEQDAGTLKTVLERLISSIEGLARTVDSAINSISFNKVDSGLQQVEQGAKEAEGVVEQMASGADNAIAKAETSAQSLEDAMDQITITRWDATEAAASDLAEAMEEVVQPAKEVQKIMDDIVPDNVAPEIQQTSENATMLRNTLNLLKQAASDLPGLFSRAGKGIKSSLAGDGSNQGIKNMVDQIDRYKERLHSLESQGYYFGDREYDEAYAELQRLTKGLNSYKSSLAQAGNQKGFSKALSSISGAVNKVLPVLKKMGSIAASVFGKIGKAVLFAGKGIGSLLSRLGKMGSLFKQNNKSAKGFSVGIGQALKSILLYQGLSKILSGIGNVLKSTVMTNDTFVSSLSKIKGNLYTAFEPITSAVMPVLNALMEVLVRVTGYLAQFTSMLFGKTVQSSQAAAAAQYEQAQALDDTAKAAKGANKQLSSIDKLNNSTDSGSGSDSSVAAPDFTSDIKTSEAVSDFVKQLKEAWANADFTEVGKTIASGLNKAMQGIDWSGIQGTADKIAKSIATLINGFAKELDWSTLGSTLGNGINTAIGFANTLVKTLDWKTIGKGIGTAIDGMIKTIDWNKLGETFGTFYSGIFKAIDNVITSIDWATAGKKIGGGVQTAIKSIDWPGIGKVFSDSFNSISSFITNFYKSVDWVGFGGNIATSINGAIRNTDWKKVGEAIANALNIAIDTAYGFISDFDWKEFGQSIADSINGFMEKTNWKKLAKGASKLVTGLLDSIVTAIKEIDWRNIGNTIGDMLTEIEWDKIAEGIIDLLVAAFNGLVSLIFGIGETIGENIMDGLKDGITLSDIIKNAGTWIKKHIFNPIVNNIKELFGIHSPSTVMAEIGKFLMQGLGNGVQSLVGDVKTKFSKLTTDIKGFFTGLPDWFEGKFNEALTKIKEVFSATALKTHFDDVWTNIKKSFSHVSSWFEDTFSKAWKAVKDVFSTGGKVYDGIKEGIADTFSAVVNKLIDGINVIIAVPFNKINGMLNAIRDAGVGAIKPFQGLWGYNPLSVPSIPKLATGTVVPANYGNFLATLGDNRREPEIVSPLSTMKQALREELAANGGSGNMMHVTITLPNGKVLLDTIVQAEKENYNATGKAVFVH